MQEETVLGVSCSPLAVQFLGGSPDGWQHVCACLQHLEMGGVRKWRVSQCTSSVNLKGSFFCSCSFCFFPPVLLLKVCTLDIIFNVSHTSPAPV